MEENMSRYGYDYGFQDNRHRAMMRGYDGDHRFVANDMGTWSSRPYNRPHGDFQGGFQGRPTEGRGYDRGMSFHPSDAIPRRMGHSYGSGYDREQGFFRGNQQPRQGFFNRGYDRSGGYDFNGGYSGQRQQGSNWQEIYRQVDRPRVGGMTSPWESNIPGMGMRPGFPYGMTRGGPWF
jgi:hypothetical protein